MSHIATGTKILTAAIDLISAGGYESMSMRTLADACGMTAGAVYKHFESKEHILDAVLNHIRSHLFQTPLYDSQEFDSLIRTHSPHEILDLYGFYHAPEEDEMLMKMYRILYAEQYNSEKVRAVTEEIFFNTPCKNLTNTLHTLEDYSLIAPGNQEAAAFVWWRTSLMYCFMCTHFYLKERCDEYFHISDFLIEAIIHGVTPMEGGSAPFVGNVEAPYFPNPRDTKIPTRARLIYAMFFLLDEYGSDRVSLRMIADTVGIRTGSLYNHFDSKDALVEETCRLIISSGTSVMLVEEDIKNAFRSGDADRIIRAVSVCNPEMEMKIHRQGYRVIFREQYRIETIREYYWRQIEEDIHIIANSLKTLAEEGTIPPSDQFYFIAKAYIYTMASINVGATMLEDQYQQRNTLRNMAARWLLGLVLNGTQSS